MRSTLFAMLLCSGTALASDASSRLPDVPSHTSEADFESTDIGCREEPFDYWGASASQQIRVIHHQNVYDRPRGSAAPTVSDEKRGECNA